MISSILTAILMVVVAIYILCAWVMIIVKRKGVPVFAMYMLPRTAYGPCHVWLWDHWKETTAKGKAQRGICVAGLEIVINPSHGGLEMVRRLRAAALSGGEK